MASPLQTGKRTVTLGTAVRGSRIRRDPPPPPTLAERRADLRSPEERDRQAAVIGIATFALAIFALVIAASSYGDWSPRDYTINMNGL